MPSSMQGGFMRDNTTRALIVTGSGASGSTGTASGVASAADITGVSSVVHAKAQSTITATLTLTNPFLTFRNSHTSLVACSDLRLVFTAPNTKETDAINSTVIKCGIEISGATYPVTFQGKNSALLDVGRGSVVSDPVPVSLTAGQSFFTRVFASAAFGNYIATTALNNIGDTTIALASLPGLTALNPVNGYLGPCTFDTGGNAEQIVIRSYNGLTATLATALTKAHASGALVGMGPFANSNSYGDLGEGSIGGASVSVADLSWSASAIAANASPQTTTTTASAGIGDTQITTVGTTSGLVAAGNTFVLDTAGNAETVTVKTVLGTANPFTILLTAPLTKAHASGVTVTAGVATGSALKPFAITADRIGPGSTPPKLIAGVGDSIVAGVGYNLRGERSFFTLALENVKPYVNMSLAGESAQQFAVASGSLRRRVALSACDWMFYEYGVNDIYGGRTLSQFQADTLTIWDFAYQRGIKIAALTLTPRTSSSDNWATTVNQTITNSGSSNPVRVAYNAWLRAGAPIDPSTRTAVAIGTGGALTIGSGAHPVNLLIEMADVVESTRDSGLWKADASGPYTADGIHPSSLGHALMATAVNPALFV